MNQVEVTKNYAQFKYLEGNRKVNKFHLKKLKESISKNNRLNLHPIIVNKNFEIIDGQHRLHAARELGIDVYFIQSDSINDEHLIECNVNQHSWEVENYIDYFSDKEKNETYILLKKYSQQTALKPKGLLALILGNINKEISNFLKTGKFKFPENKIYEQIIGAYITFMSYVDDKKVSPKSMFTNFYFSAAFRWLFMTNGFSLEVFLKKLDLRWFDLKPQRGAQEWYKLLISIYNFKSHKPIEQEFGKEN